MSYKDSVRALLEEAEDLASDLEYDEEIDWNKADKAIGVLGAIIQDLEELLRMF